MESEGEPGNQQLLSILLSAGLESPGTFVFQVLVLLLLLFLSALLSGSEVAFFSIRGEELSLLKASDKKTDKVIVQLLARPKRLLATILLGNNVINIAIVVLSTSIINPLLAGMDAAWSFAIQVIVVTFLLVLLGEVTPKVYAQYRTLTFASFIAMPMSALARMLGPFSWVLVRSSSIFERRISKYQSELSKDELNEAIELTSDDETSQQEKNILKGIVNFGNITVKQVMKPRQDVVAYASNTDFKELKKEINIHRFSRLPIYEGDIDKVLGILHVKDLLPYLDHAEGFDWNQLVRKPYFVPEQKQIDQLLTEFKTKKMHMAIVVDEYGGTEGVVTMEDILEEIVGEINDEFDDTEVFYSKLEDNIVVFDGKTSLSDVIKVMKLDTELFEDYKNDVESIGGLATELHGKIPTSGTIIEFEDLELRVEFADRKRVRRVKLTLTERKDD